MSSKHNIAYYIYYKAKPEKSQDRVLQKAEKCAKNLLGDRNENKK